MNEITNYYIEKYGSPARTAEFVSKDGIEIKIYKWTAEQTKEGVSIYSTMGANSRLSDKAFACEFFIGLTPDADDIAGALAEVALHGSRGSQPPKNGDSITLSHPLWDGTNARSFLFTDGDEILPPLQLKDKLITFIQLVPLFDSELNYKKDNGEQKLWAAFEAKKTPYWCSNREPAL